MKVSVVIPAYNEEKNIEQCVRAVLDQEEPADEIIIVDNNSTDRTAEIAQSLGVTVVTEKKQGITPARNTGFRKAKYEIIARTDADTCVPPDWIKRFKHYFHMHQCDAVVGSVHYIHFPLKVNILLYEDFLAIVKRMFGTYPLIGMNMAVKKDTWEKVQNELCQEDHQVHEDIDLAIHIHQAGRIVCHDPENIVTASDRRIIFNPQSFFIEYTQRLLNMKKTHT